MDDETVTICTGLFLVGGVALIGLNGCNRQHPPSKAAKEPPQVLDIAVVGMARSVIDKAKGVETMLERQAIGQQRLVRKGLHTLENWNSWTQRMSSSLQATIQLV